MLSINLSDKTAVITGPTISIGWPLLKLWPELARRLL